VFIQHIELASWRNFRKVDIVLPPRAFLIGPNASGKSNLLDAMRFLRDVSTIGLRLAVEQKRGGVSAIRCLAARSHSDILLRVVLASDEGVHRWLYELAFNQDSAKTPIVKREVVEDLSAGQRLLDRPDEQDRTDPLRRTQTALEQIIANQGFREVADFLRSIEYRHIVPQAVRDPTEFSPRPVRGDPFGRDFIQQIWETPKATRKARLRRILKVLQVAVPQLSELDIVVDPPGSAPHVVVRYEHWRPHPAKQTEAQLSDGTLRLFGLLWALFEGDGPLLLEEPELSLHPEIVRQLPELFARVQSEVRSMRRRAGAGRRQLVVSTHSRDLLNGAGIGSDEVIRLEPTPDGTRALQTSASERLQMLHGLTAADVLLPKTIPKQLSQLLLAFVES